MLSDLIKDRLNKRKILEKEGYNLFPSAVRRTYDLKFVNENFDKLQKTKKRIFIAGRVMGLRKHGSISFIDLRDENGKLQILLKKTALKDYLLLRENIDIGDFVEAGGILFITKAGEKSLDAKSIKIITKSLRPLPSTWHGLQDVEERYRKRYLDLIFNDNVKKTLELRSKIIKETKAYLCDQGFTEVETPILQSLPGGANAKPFITHFNALNEDFYLRIAPELYLKRLLVGGFEKIFEIGKNFRNEGMDREHSPEFTSLELYWAYQDYDGLMKFAEKWLKAVIKKAGIKNNPLSKKWQVITYKDAFEKYGGVNLEKLKTGEIDQIFKKTVRPKIKDPTLIIDYPKEISPLAKSKDGNKNFVERFQLIINGMEIINAFSELNDPIDQKERMEKEEKMYRAGNTEASRLDEEFIEALEYGMPPAAGLGLGIDRFVALLTGVHAIKDATFFTIIKRKTS